jgi:hypothetical protein
LRYADLGRFGDTSRYEYWPPHLYDPALIGDTPGFIHPVLDPPRYARSRLMYGGERFLEPHSPMRRDLERLAPEILAPALRACFEQRGERANLFRLRAYLRSRGLRALDAPVDLALGCSVTRRSSSRSVDLGDDHIVDTILGDGAAGSPEFSVYSSLDGITWTPQGYGNASAERCVVTLAPPIVARYIRVDTGQANGPARVRIYGDAIALSDE